MENEKSVLRWGGLAGILAFIVWIVEMPLYGSIDPFAPEGLVRFTDNRAVLGLSTILMMTIAFLSIALVLALYRSLRETNLKFTLFGSVLGVAGYIVTALGDASTFFAFAPISSLNQVPAATPETQATAVFVWRTTQGITNTFFFVGILFIMTCFIVLGLAMLTSLAFGRRFGGGVHTPRCDRRSRHDCKSVYCRRSRNASNGNWRPFQYHLSSPLRMEGLQSVERTALTYNLTKSQRYEFLH